MEPSLALSQVIHPLSTRRNLTTSARLLTNCSEPPERSYGSTSTPAARFRHLLSRQRPDADATLSHDVSLMNEERA